MFIKSTYTLAEQEVLYMGHYNRNDTDKKYLAAFDIWKFFGFGKIWGGNIQNAIKWNANEINI